MDINNENRYYTLGYGKRARSFWAYVDEKGITVFTGSQGKTKLFLEHSLITECLNYFKGKGWFPLGNRIDKVEPGSLGEYFKYTLKKSPKFASHFASVLASQGRLEYRYGYRNKVELKVTEERSKEIKINSR